MKVISENMLSESARSKYILALAGITFFMVVFYLFPMLMIMTVYFSDSVSKFVALPVTLFLVYGTFALSSIPYNKLSNRIEVYLNNDNLTLTIDDKKIQIKKESIDILELRNYKSQFSIYIQSDNFSSKFSSDFEIKLIRRLHSGFSSGLRTLTDEGYQEFDIFFATGYTKEFPNQYSKKYCCTYVKNEI